MFLSNFSLHFFEIDASTKLVFVFVFNAKYLTFFGGEMKQSQISMCIFFKFFLALTFPCGILCVCSILQTLQVH